MNQNGAQNNFENITKELTKRFEQQAKTKRTKSLRIAKKRMFVANLRKI